MPQKLSETVRRHALFLVGAAVLCMSVGINMHAAMNVNFLKELLSATSWQQGYLESFRELGGLTPFFVLALLAGRSEPRIAALMLLIMGAGLSAYCRLHVVTQVMFVSLAWSVGFHTWAPLSSSLTLALSPRGHEGHTVGTIGRVGAAGTFLALGGVWLLRTRGGMGMRELFLIAGLVTAVGAVPLLFVPGIRVRSERVPLLRMFEPRFRLYLALEFADGMRKQIFILFAVLCLVQEHGIPVETIALLMLANQGVNFILAPLAGRLVDRIGERSALTAYFTGLIVVFLLYALMTDVRALYVVYVLDNAMWQLRIGVTTYANRIAAGHERTRLLSMGITMNHIGSVSMPLIGGALYAALGYRFPFLGGAALALFSIFLARRVPLRKPLAHPGLTAGPDRPL